jgi:hypothetical protein
MLSATALHTGTMRRRRRLIACGGNVRGVAGSRMPPVRATDALPSVRSFYPMQKHDNKPRLCCMSACSLSWLLCELLCLVTSCKIPPSQFPAAQANSKPTHFFSFNPRCLYV